MLRAADTVTRTALVSRTGLSPATVTRVVDGLLREGWLAEGPAVASGRIGRAAVSLHLQAQRGVVVGVDLGGSNCRAVVADLRGAPRHRLVVPTPNDLDAAALADWVVQLVDRLRRQGGAPLTAVAIGLPGVVAPGSAIVAGAPNLPQIEGGTFTATLRQRLAAPLALDNDSNFALLGEMTFGAAQSLHTVAMLTVGTGVGTGVAVNGRLLTGRTGLVGEFGFVPVGPGKRSLEYLLGGAGLLHQAQRSGLRINGAEQLFTADAPAPAQRIRSRFRSALLMLLATIATAYEPEAVIIGGGLAPAIAAELSHIQMTLQASLPAAPRIAVSTLGDLAGALGGLVAACRLAYVHLGVDEDQLTGLPAAATLDGVLGSASPKERSVPIATA